MLQSFRDNLKGTVAKGIIALMIVPFALFGVDSLFLSDGSGTDAAVVDGESISLAELSKAIYLQKQQMLSRFGQNIPAEFLADERLRAPVLEDLVRRRLSVNFAQGGGMAANTQELDTIILGGQQFQIDGRFDAQRYTQTLRMMGFTPSTYKKMLAEEVVISQLANGLTLSGFATQAELEHNATLSEQTRDFYYLTLSQDAIAEAVQIDENAIADYYENNQAQFMAPQQISTEYIEVSPGLLSASVDVTESDLLAQYELDMESFEAKTERRAAHILFEIQDDDAHIALSQDAAKRLVAGEEFAELAKELSNDTISAEQGGDLGFTTGDIFPPAFEAALAALELGAVSEVVETEAGLHIIKLLDVQATEKPSFEEQRNSISQTLTDAAAEEHFLEILEDLGDLTYNAESLTEAAEILGLTVTTSELFPRAGGTGLMANSLVLETVFSDDVLVEGNTSDVIELADNRVVVLRIVENKPAQVKPLQAVRESIAAELKTKRVRETLLASADEMQSELEQGAEFEALAKERGLDWQVSLNTHRNDFKVNKTLLNFVFELPRPINNAQIGGVFLDDGNYALLSLNKVVNGDGDKMPAAQKRQLGQALSRAAGQNDYAVFEAFLKAGADITLY